MLDGVLVDASTGGLTRFILCVVTGIGVDASPEVNVNVRTAVVTVNIDMLTAFEKLLLLC